MKNVFARLACLLVLLAVALTGCSMIEIDPIKQLEEDMAALDKDYSSVIVTYDGGQLTKGDLMADYYYQYSYFTYMYHYYYGSSLTEEDAEAIAESVAQGYMNTMAVLKKAEELGITVTEEEIAQCEEFAQTNWQAEYDAAYASAEGETEEERRLNTEYTLASQGMSYEYFYHQQEWEIILTKTEEAVKAEAPQLTEEELNSAYADRVMDDEAAYSQDLTSYEKNQLDGTVLITWNPDGYRTVKHVLFVPDDEVLTEYINTRNEITTANSELAALNNERLSAKNGEGERSVEEIEADIEAKQAELDALNAQLADCEAACIANVQDKVDLVYARLEAGEDFDTIMAEMGEDPGMTMEPAKSTGYYVCGASETWDYSFRNGAMDLEQVGDYSAEPVVSASGVHIIYYASDVTAGAVPLDDVREDFTAIAQADADNVYFSGLCTEWVAAMNPQYNIGNFFNNED